jgi:hypothetical protein
VCGLGRCRESAHVAFVFVYFLNKFKPSQS